MNTKRRLKLYIEQWQRRGYADGIPEEVPPGVEEFAPSWKAVAVALLKNDMNLTSLGFSPPKSKWYTELKRIEIEKRKRDEIPVSKQDP